MNTREIGNIGEDAVCDFLEKKSYKVIERNYVIRGGEIDIIATKNDIIAFVEVKTRSRNPMVSGFEAITKSKMSHIFKTAQDYLLKNNFDLQPRFDVAVVEITNGKVNKINFIENAYDMSDN